MTEKLKLPPHLEKLVEKIEEKQKQQKITFGFTHTEIDCDEIFAMQEKLKKRGAKK